MYLAKTPSIIKPIFKDLTWKIKTNKKEIFITFDDGPEPEVTPQVLSVLEQYSAKATFFCIGENIKKHPEIFRRVLAGGHSVGNHSENHLNGWKTENISYFKNVLKCQRRHEFKMYRPPYGKITKHQASILKSRYKIVMWDVLSGDFDQKITSEKCLENVINNAEEGSIIVFHDSQKAKEKMLYTLPKFLEQYTKKGFEFKAL